MSKILRGKVISNKMKDTVVVDVVRLFPHPLYKKLLKRSKKYKVGAPGQKIQIGETVKIIETRPSSRDKHFKLFDSEKPVKKPAAKVKKSAQTKDKEKA
jgi:small subunit ribosomal protein S17